MLRTVLSSSHAIHLVLRLLACTRRNDRVLRLYHGKAHSCMRNLAVDSPARTSGCIIYLMLTKRGVYTKEHWGNLRLFEYLYLKLRKVHRVLTEFRVEHKFTETMWYFLSYWSKLVARVSKQGFARSLMYYKDNHFVYCYIRISFIFFPESELHPYGCPHGFPWNHGYSCQIIRAAYGYPW